MEFIDNTQQLSGGGMELTEAERFLLAHHEMVERLVEDQAALRVKLNRRLVELGEEIARLPASTGLARAPWIYQKHKLVLDFKSPHFGELAIDITIGLGGWKAQLFDRDDSLTESGRFVASELPNRLPAPKLDKAAGRFTLATWPIDTELRPIAEDLAHWIDAVVAWGNASP